jgi:hypothetical protein
MHFTLKIDDGICKGFKDEEGTDLFVNKAYDEETNTHCLLIFMPSFPKYNLLGIQQPLAYESEQQRDEFYTHGVNDEFANTFIKNLSEHVENSRKNAENQG